MRHKKRLLTAPVKGNLALRFTGHGISSYGGLELFRRFLHDLDFSNRLRRHLRRTDPTADYSSVSIVRLIVALLVVGASRLRHVNHAVNDPMVHRFCGLRVLPSERTLSRWLSRCTKPVRNALQAVNSEVIADGIEKLKLKRLTVDVDGTVISTGHQVERAFRGFNVRRNVPSYYPITAFLAQTGQFLRVKNRSGNIHDGKSSMPFLRELFQQLDRMAPGAALEVRLDGAFFLKDVLAFLQERAEFAIRVPFFKWLDLQALIRERRKWERVGVDVEGFRARVFIRSWKRTVDVAIYRKRVSHPTSRNYQLDLFDPSNGTWEYSAVATNKSLSLKALWEFMAGRGGHERAIAELKNGFAFDTVPCQTFAGNSAWQILSILAHNLTASFQIQTGAPRRPKSLKRTCLFALKRIATLRYEVIGRAGIVQFPQGRPTLTLAENLPTRHLFERIGARLGRAA